MFRIPCSPPSFVMKQQWQSPSELANNTFASSPLNESVKLSSTLPYGGSTSTSFYEDYPHDDNSFLPTNQSQSGVEIFDNFVAHNLSLTGTSSSAFTTSPRQSQWITIPEMIEEFLITRVITIICALGIAGNLLNLVVLTRHRLRCAGSMERLERTAHTGLAVLATSDLLFCITLLPHAFVDRNAADYTRVTFDLVYAVYRNGTINVFTMTSTWLTVSMAISRYLAVCHPLRARRVLGMTVTRVSVVAVFIVSCAFNVPRFFVESIADMPCAEGYSVYFRFPRIRSSAWLNAYGWLYFAACIALPLVVLVFCNAHLIYALRLASSQRKHLTLTLAARRSSEKTRVLTLTLVVIVIMYVAFVVPAEFVHFVQTRVQRHWQSKPVVNMLVAVVNTMQAMTFSVNFLLYCLINSHFRRNFRDLFLPQRCFLTSASVSARGGAAYRRTSPSDVHPDDAYELVSMTTLSRHKL